MKHLKLWGFVNGEMITEVFNDMEDLQQYIDVFNVEVFDVKEIRL